MEIGATSIQRRRRRTFVVAGLIALGVACTVLARQTRSPDQLWRSIQDDLKAGRFDRAKGTMDQLLRLRPPGDQELFVLGQLAIARGRDREAIDHLARVSDGHPQAARAHTWAGAIELRQKCARKAEVALLRAMSLDRNDPAPRRELIRLYCMQRRRRELSEQFAALSRLTTLTFNEVLLWGTSLTTSWDPSEVQPILEGFVKADPDDRCSRLVLAEALRRLRRENDVETVLARLPAADPDARAIRARIALGRGDVAEVERLTSDQPHGHPGLARIRADLALSRRDLPQACNNLRQALVGDPHSRHLLYQLGDALVRAGNVDEGRRYISLAKGHDALYELFEQFEQTAESRERTDDRLLRRIGKASLDLGLRDEARAWYLLALELDPANPETQQALYALEHHEAARSAESPIVNGAPGPSNPPMPLPMTP